MIKEHKFKTIKTSRYYTSGVLNDQTKCIWFIFHGYGQLAGEFLNEFMKSVDNNMFIVSLEALNRFYFRGFSGKVGASWMTSESRNDDISDYSNYINSVYSKIIESLPLSNLSFNILGFSQGTHTAVRWINRYKIKVNNLILWSGTFPHDVDYTEDINYWTAIKKYKVIGKRDRLINQEKMNEELNYLEDKKMNVEIIYFNGGHELDPGLLLELLHNV